MKSVLLLIALVWSVSMVHAQRPRLFAGPMVGSVTTTSAKVWIGYRGRGKNAVILGDTSTKKIYYPTDYSYLSSNGRVALTFNFTGLQPDHVYNVLVSIEGWRTHVRTSFRTQAAVPVKDFTFSVGSCALMNTDASQAVFPGGKGNIFNAIRRQHSTFMLWLGNTVYYLKSGQYSSVQGMFDRTMDVRKDFKKFRFFITGLPHYAIWGEHDYGPSNANGQWAMKDSSLMVFKSFWPNTYPDAAQLNGNYFSFRYYDAEFFMTDDRFYRDAAGDSSASFFGATQLAWLQNKLMLSDATFKFIAVGAQVVNQHFGDTYSSYPRERQELFDFITRNNIKGVIFLTGDRHYSEISREIVNGYPIIDFTSSSLMAPLLPHKLFGAMKNPERLPHTEYGLHCFGQISLSGPVGDRKCRMQIISRWGRKKKELAISANELQRSVQ